MNSEEDAGIGSAMYSGKSKIMIVWWQWDGNQRENALWVAKRQPGDEQWRRKEDVKDGEAGMRSEVWRRTEQIGKKKVAALCASWHGKN